MTKKFYQLSPAERLETLDLPTDLADFYKGQQSVELENIIENYLADFRLPEGLLHHLVVDGKVYEVPMVTEEPSVVAAANNGARMIGLAGGFSSKKASQPLLGGQILFKGVNQFKLQAFVDQNKAAIFAAAEKAKPSMVERGDGLKKVNLRFVGEEQAALDLTVQTGKAMGANAVNTILEAVKSCLQPYQDNIVAAILTNSGRDALVTVQGSVPVEAVGGEMAAEKIVSLSDFSKDDVDRAVTENKGIFNGLSAVVMATGNDYRAVEAAGHAYAAKSGKYQSLSTWQLSDDKEALVGQLTMPLNIGVLGGAIAALPMAQKNLELLGNPTVDELKKVILATGLANNLAALKAVSGKGIQSGHMKMQARVLAVQAGARPDEIMAVADELAQSGQIDQENAERILGELRRP
ncbi:hydroxymethylglutaryl-CoA reductase, degradative [Fructobacillus sp. CRL 2054]|uniref:hydroxymethylglutaryl-CoA reductase, degradative n=1 Tax=Fructobacillus sp. CRL 2054 TaxID=2763007 RepID=UPI002378C3D3|nr:hydroxymethylglutaryl-CoA reductase, degradative [Fructobacillus sp. CRL 2054]MDD9138052.1 hydroxymethylglutaryl-CoA reductase, degradative [Fructobacillus sp. CRL 2054]